MKYLLFLGGVLMLGFSKIDQNQQKYLPVYISMLDSSTVPPGILLNIKAAFANRKIKTLGKKDVESLIYNEITSVTQDYARSGGDLADFEKLKNYQAANTNSVGNNLIISIKMGADGSMNDTIKWDNRTIPVNLVNPHKTKWHYMILDSSNAKTMLQMSQSIVDSIISSNVLVKE